MSLSRAEAEGAEDAAAALSSAGAVGEERAKEPAEEAVDAGAAALRVGQSRRRSCEGRAGGEARFETSGGARGAPAKGARRRAVGEGGEAGSVVERDGGRAWEEGGGLFLLSAYYIQWRRAEREEGRLGRDGVM